MRVSCSRTAVGGGVPLTPPLPCRSRRNSKVRMLTAWDVQHMYCILHHHSLHFFPKKRQLSVTIAVTYSYIFYFALVLLKTLRVLYRQDRENCDTLGKITTVLYFQVNISENDKKKCKKVLSTSHLLIFFFTQPKIFT